MATLPSIESLDLDSEPWVPSAAGSRVGGLFGRHFRGRHSAAEGAPRAELLLVHGYGEHHGRYARQIAHLVSRGVSVYALDLPGHGRSPGRRAVVDCAELVAVVHEAALGLAADARERGLPLLLFGHSMGGLLAAATTLRVPGLADSIFLSSPALRVGDGVPAAVERLGGALAAIAPAAPAEKLDPAGISRVPDYVDDYESDPLVAHRWVPALTGTSMLALGRRTREQAGALATPTHIVHGAEDPIASIAGSREFASRSAWVREERGEAPLVVLTEVAGGLHELFNDLAEAEAYAALDSWLDSVLAPSAA